MKGLLIKDFNLLKNNKQFFVMIMLVGGAFALAWDTPNFAISYVSIVFTMFTISTISYDEYDNGMAYLFALPVTRRGYALEKYVFGGVMVVCALAGMSALSWIVVAVKQIAYPLEEWAGVAGGSILVVIVLLALMIPLQFKFEADKSRIVLLAVCGCTALLAYAIAKISFSLGFDMGKAMEGMITGHPGGMITGCVLAGLLILAISYTASVKILEKKEF